MPWHRPLPTRLPLTPASAAKGAARFSAWVIDLAAIMVLGYTVRQWPALGASTAAGFVGTAIAMLNDSWEVASRFDTTDHFPTLRAARTAMHDLISLAICLGGVMVLLFTEASSTHARQRSDANDWRVKDHYLTLDQAFLATISVSRLFFAVWAGCTFSRERSAPPRYTRPPR